MYIKVGKNTIDTKLMMLLIIYRLIIDIAYYKYIAVSYAYDGFQANWDMSRIIVTYILMVLLFIFTPNKISRVLELFLNIQLIIMLIPILSYYSFSDGSTIFLIVCCIAHLLQCLLCRLKSNKINIRITETRMWIKIGMPIVVIGIFALTVKENGLPTMAALDFANVYDIRREIKDVFGLGYLYGWACRIIIPMFFVYNIRKKKHITAWFYLIFQVLIYMIIPHKTFLLIIPIIIILSQIILSKNIMYWIYGSLSSLSAISIIYYELTNEIMLLSLYVRRLLYVPAFLKFKYYEFYSQGPKNWFAYTRFGELFNVEPNYPYTTSTMVASYVRGEYWTGANTGYWGDAYAQGGLIMIIIMSLLLVGILLLIEKMTHNLEKGFVFASVFYILMTLNDGALLSSILTGGLGIYIIIVYLLDCDEYMLKNNKEKLGFSKEIK